MSHRPSAPGEPLLLDKPAGKYLFVIKGFDEISSFFESIYIDWGKRIYILCPENFFAICVGNHYIKG